MNMQELTDKIDEQDPATAWAKGPRCIKCSHPCFRGIFPDKGKKRRAWHCMACDVIQVTHQFLCEEGTGEYYRTTYLPTGSDLEEIRNGRL